MLLKIVLTDPYIVTIGCLIIGDHIRLISIVFLFVVIYHTLVSHEWGQKIILQTHGKYYTCTCIFHCVVHSMLAGIFCVEIMIKIKYFYQCYCFGQRHVEIFKENIYTLPFNPLYPQCELDAAAVTKEKETINHYSCLSDKMEEALHEKWYIIPKQKSINQICFDTSSCLTL